MGARVTRFMKRPLETQRKVEKILENKPRPAPRYPSSKAALAEEQKSEYSKQISVFIYLLRETATSIRWVEAGYVRSNYNEIIIDQWAFKCDIEKFKVFLANVRIPQSLCCCNMHAMV